MYRPNVIVLFAEMMEPIKRSKSWPSGSAVYQAKQTMLSTDKQQSSYCGDPSDPEADCHPIWTDSL